MEPTEPERQQQAPLRLLSFDGGGVRGLSSLMILNDLMQSIALEEKNLGLRAQDDNDPLRPCDYFDLIGGTSTGGIIAIMLSRLRLDCKQCILVYRKLAKIIFQDDRSIGIFGMKIPWGANRFSGDVLANAIKTTLKDLGYDENEAMWDQDLHKAIARGSDETRSRYSVCRKANAVGCHGFVLTSVKNELGLPNLLTTYDPDDQNTTIWKALRATSAAPGFFEQMLIGKVACLDGGLGFNNPCVEVDLAARKLWEGRSIGIITSIGTGIKVTPSIKQIASWLPFGLGNVLSLKAALMSMATCTARVDNEMQLMYNDSDTTYYRFNVDQGLAGIGLEEWMRESEMASCTEKYMHAEQQVGRVNEFAELMIRLSAPLPNSKPAPPIADTGSVILDETI